MSGAPIPALVVGTGFGCRVHVPALRATGFEVAGLVGTRPDKLARKAEKVRVPATFTDLDEAIERTGARVVVVATPPESHAGLVLRAIAHGCHVVCEKPMVVDIDEGAQMLAAAEAAGVVHVMGNEFRFQPDRALIGRAITDGKIGEPRFLTHVQYVPFAADLEERLPTWWFNRAAGGGWLGASGSHIVDQILSWLGDIASLSAALPIVSDRSDVAEDSFSVRFRAVCGLEGIVQQSGGAWGARTVTWRVAGTKGTIWTEDGVVRIADRKGERTLVIPDDLRLPPPPASADGDPSARYSHLELGPYIRLYAAFRAATKGKLAIGTPLPTFRDGLASMVVLDAIRRSAAQDGARIALA